MFPPSTSLSRELTKPTSAGVMSLQTKPAVSKGTRHPVRAGVRSLAVVLDGEDLSVPVRVLGSSCRRGRSAHDSDVADHVQAVDLDVKRLSRGAVLHLSLPVHGAVARPERLEGERPQRGHARFARELELARPARQLTEDQRDEKRQSRTLPFHRCFLPSNPAARWWAVRDRR